MSIAVSAIVGPSHTHRWIFIGAGLALCAAAFAVGVSASARFAAAPLQALLLAAAGGTLICAGRCPPKTHRIDISGTGELVLTVQQGLRLPGAAEGAAAVSSVMNLLPGSLVWPVLMLLRLEDPAGGVQVLPVWRDSLAPGTWRALSVAVLAMARRNEKIR